MNNKSIIAMALIAVAIMTTTSVAYADPNWHELVLELQSDLAALTTNVDSDISGLDARLTALESQSSAFIPSLYFVAVLVTRGVKIKAITKESKNMEIIVVIVSL